jgi:26S proteasome regulatory subunit N5
LPTQIFLEVERARLTRMLARIAEDRGKPQEAADIMQEVAVETYGALSKEEKVAFVLEQVRLVLDRGDYARAQILAKKINTRTFAELDAAKDGEKKVPKRDSTIAPPEEVRMIRLVLVAGEQSLCASSRVCRERLRWRS